MSKKKTGLVSVEAVMAEEKEVIIWTVNTGDGSV
jgi:hypothetical protein